MSWEEIFGTFLQNIAEEKYAKRGIWLFFFFFQFAIHHISKQNKTWRRGAQTYNQLHHTKLWSTG